MYHEAKGENLEGQLAVAQVVLNRVKHPYWKDSICSVVSEPNQFHWYPNTSGNWTTLRGLSVFVLLSHHAGIPVSKEVSNSYFFARTGFSDPRLKLEIRIGNHKFYSFKES